MKRIVHKFRISKFKRFTEGMLFAIISVIALVLCITDISDIATTQLDIILPFSIAIISLLLGFFAMFHNNETSKEKI